MKLLSVLVLLAFMFTVNLGCQSENQNTVAPPAESAAAKTEELRKHYSDNKGEDLMKQALEAAQKAPQDQAQKATQEQAQEEAK